MQMCTFTPFQFNVLQRFILASTRGSSRCFNQIGEILLQEQGRQSGESGEAIIAFHLSAMGLIQQPET